MNNRQKMAALYQRRVVTVLEKHVLKVALDIYGTLKVVTPVDTGRARANWHMDIDTPTVRIVEPGQDTSPNISQYKIGQTVFVSNNLPYIRRLNDGWSSQAPAGFVEAAIDGALSRAK